MYFLMVFLLLFFFPPKMTMKSEHDTAIGTARNEVVHSMQARNKYRYAQVNF